MTEPNALTKATILVVDDTQDNLAMISKPLKNDYTVQIAIGGEKALEIATSATPPDLILLGIMMPGMDGYEVCRRLKRDPKTTNIPIIFLAAQDQAGDERKGLELGAVDFVSKPISPPIVMARVKNHLALKAMTDLLQARNFELERARSVLEKADRAKSSFLSSMSHELRSPLNAILGFGQLLESDSPPPTPAQKESITQILQAGWHLLKLINEILDLAKVESGQVPMLREPVPLGEVILECRGMIESQAQLRGIKLVFPWFDLPYYVLADRTRVKQVLLNLLANALKYNRKQGKVEVKCTESQPGHIRVSIRDTGKGLYPEQLSQLFQPFNRLGQEGGGEEGTGIGLVVAKRLVELMGGIIGVESKAGVGSVFWFELLSVAKPHFLKDGSKAAPVALPQPSHELGRHVLLYVEDNPANLKLVEKIVARHPELYLLTAMNGNSGVEIARVSRPDVILMDINLPDINGFEALEILRANPVTAHIPVIAISANVMPRDIENGRKAGFFSYITKPIRITEFLEVLDAALICAEQNNSADSKKEP